MTRRLLSTLAALAAVTAAPLAHAAQTSAECLDRLTMEAARIHQFQTMMMTVSLRCKAHGVDVEGSFARMLDVHRAAFGAADRVMHAFVSPAHGFVDRRAFDTYLTQVANRYGGGASNPTACTAIDRTLQTVIADASGRRLHFAATAMIAHPEMERLACSVPAQKPAPSAGVGAPARAASPATVALAAPPARPQK
ncbi:MULTISPECIES: hypothetical protein [unclassified Novosphingobium]|uniref:hypothetical protein n=1 Tax=Novosphingobium TaxID=165696 RepID=UPI00146B5110|nr:MULTISPECIES: hypothetical protein [unclassified Novosphingobium]NMN03224.1 hypothetical protein [Novosphingobium sp. SG919]NMN86786.1 hypothetical protein [Novosphingobium sp. SG916]